MILVAIAETLNVYLMRLSEHLSLSKPSIGQAKSVASEMRIRVRMALVALIIVH